MAKRPVPLYDFAAFGQAIKEARTDRNESLYADYGKLKKRVQEYGVIKRNINSILQAEKWSEWESKVEGVRLNIRIPVNHY